MSIDKVEKAVIAEAEEQARRIIEKARSESDEHLAKARQEGQNALAAAVEAAKLEAERETARQLGRARHEGRLEVLKAKNEILDRVFGQAAGSVAAMDDASYLALFAKWLSNLPGDAAGAVHVNPKDRKRFTDDFLASVNAAREASGKLGPVVADQDVPDGVIVQGGDFSFDLTIAGKLENARAALASELTREIFS